MPDDLLALAAERAEQSEPVVRVAALLRKSSLLERLRSAGLADALSAQTGLRVSCCQAFVAGIPWGLADTFFEANDEPARSILKRLFTAAAINQPDRDYWLQRCDPLPSAWCFINLAHIFRENVSTFSRQPAVPPGANIQPPTEQTLPFWFEPGTRRCKTGRASVVPLVNQTA